MTHVRAQARKMFLTLFVLFTSLVTHAPVAQSASSAPQVRSVLFFSPNCPHCHHIMQEYLPPLLKRYGDRLAVVAINVETGEGLAVYRAAALHFDLAREQLGVPALVVGDRILVGSAEIPADFPELIELGLRKGGVAWPLIPEVRTFLQTRHHLEAAGLVIAQNEAAESGSDSTAAMFRTASTSKSRGPAANFARDPIANSVAVAVAIFIAAALVHSVKSVVKQGIAPAPQPRSLPVLATLGVGVAGYLAFIEWSGNTAVCGPIGHCNEVQSSAYAQLFGVPVAVLGVVTYLALAFAWLWSRLSAGRQRAVIAAVSWGLAFVGVLFSLYLTLLEPFVIGATCMWCITSATLMTLILHELTRGARHRQFAA